MKHVACYIKNYPRPQFVRKSWINLNGEWDFAFDKDNQGEKFGWGSGFASDIKIRVPFTYECEASGIKIKEKCDYVWYSRSFQYKLSEGNRLLLNFEGSDYITKIWINGKFVSKHKGGYTRFTVDIADYLQSGNNYIIVKCEDDSDTEHSRGKQRWRKDSYFCWYAETTGIWKTIWLEEVSDIYISEISLETDIDNDCVIFEGRVSSCQSNTSLEIEVRLDGQLVSCAKYVLMNEHFRITQNIRSNMGDPSKVILWYDYSPVIYDVTFKLNVGDNPSDIAGSYFGLCKFDIRNDVINLNYSPFYSKMVLNQGYFDKGDLTPLSEDDLYNDVALIKTMGFNGVRLHQKIEDERFFYYCDIMGLTVWCEMPSSYAFTPAAVQNAMIEWPEIIMQYKSHPSLMAWVIFNESWGISRVRSDRREQEFTEAMYHLTKTLDYRPVICNDGWENTVNDIVTIHNYAQVGSELESAIEYELLLAQKVSGTPMRNAFADGYMYKGQPIMVTEFGGIAFSDEHGWGYGDTVKDKEEYLNRMEGLIDAIKRNRKISGYCFTQFNDVQQEVNGLLTIDRKCKTDIKRIAAINSKGR